CRVEGHAGDLLHVAFIVGEGLDDRVIGARTHAGIEHVVDANAGDAPAIGPVAVDFGVGRTYHCAEAGAGESSPDRRPIALEPVHSYCTSTMARPRTARPLTSR